jgi:hypothetical protein
MRWSRTFVLIASTMTVAACATASSFNSTWKNPDAAPVSLNGKKVLAIVQIRDEARRREGEDLLAAAITEHGGQGIASYTLFPSNARQQDEAVAERKAMEVGISGIVIMSVTGREQTRSRVRNVSPPWFNDPYYRHAWRAWGHGWNQMWVSESVRTDTRVMVETRVYSIEQDKLLWTGSSETLNPESSGDVIRSLSSEVAKQLKASGVLMR